MKRSILLLILFTVVTSLSLSPVMAPCEPPIEISKRLKCPTAPGWSDNPPYYVGEHYYWWIEIEVTAHEDLSNVIVYDRLGAELMMNAITVEETTMQAQEYDYTFSYLYGWNGQVYVNGIMEGYLNKEGVTFDGFHISWTGKSVKVHFTWEIGAMSADETRMIWLVVSTDINPADHQEYTSPGCYEMNSGSTVKAVVASTGKQFSAESESIRIHVYAD